VPEIPGLSKVGYWTSDTLLDAAEIPASFVVLGGGAIALEMAHFLEGIGRKVTVLQRSAQLLKGMDADLAQVVRESLENRGIEVHCGTKLVRAEFDESRREKVLVFERDGRTERVGAVEILVALGRRAALSGLGLDEVGIGLQCSDTSDVKATQQTSHPRVFAAGDACSPIEVVHLAIQQGEVAARNAAAILRGEPPSATMDYRCKLFGVFTQPQVAALGLSETEARERHPGCLVAKYPFDDHGKSMVMGETEGFVKLIAHPESGMILGGSVVGPEAIELIHEISVAMHLRATVSQLAAAPHYHPTLSEIWTYPAEEIAENLKNNS
jgi:pyruvate/2-oxoglutarate dehydrogenase complex dihydrolipoamide dehydrogenase (E3) component